MRLFICQAVPNEFIKNYNVSQAATTFCFDLIDNNCFDSALSLLPVNINDNIKSDCKHYKTKFVQCRLFPHNKIFRNINNLIENVIIVKKSFKYNSIWFYNITLTNLMSAFILRFILFKKVYAVIADYNPPVNKISSDNFIKYIIGKLNGIITLSARGNKLNKNNCCIPGIIPTSKILKYSPNLKTRKFLFSGVLNKVKGIDMVIDVFSKIPHAELIITGRGNDELKNIVNRYDNIKYLGFLSQEEYKKVFSEITFCLNFRNPMLPENDNNFPSKILEYFLYNKIVISTIRYPELKKFNYFYVPFSVENIIKLVNKLIIIENENLTSYCNHTDQLNKKFSETQWKTKLIEIEAMK